jgi:outer membrane cobalamin receptor
MRISLTLLIFLTLQFTAGRTLADVPDTIQLSTIEIKSSAINAELSETRSYFDTLSLKALGSRTLSDLLGNHSNVFIKSNGPGGLSSASFRGTAANHTLVLWNGFPVNGLQHGQVDFSTIPIFFIDQINLGWGHSAVKKRSGGLGGLVEMNNKPDFGKRIEVDFLQTAGSFSTFGSFAGFSFNRKKIHIKTRVFRKSSLNNFEYLNTASYPKQRMNQENAGYTDKGFLQEAHFNSRNSLISFASWNQWNDRSLPPIMTNLDRGGDPKEFQTDRFHRNFLSWKYFWNGGKLELSTSYFIEFQHYYLRTTNALPPHQTVTLIDSHNESSGLMNSFEFEHRLFKRTDVFAQLLFDAEKVNSNSFSSNKKRNKLSVLSGVRTTLSEGFGAEVSIRNDWLDEKNSGLSPSASFNFAPKSMKVLRFDISIIRNMRFPSMNDLYWFPGGNRDLKPEQSTNADFSINFSPEILNSKLNVRVSAYISEITEWIQWRPTAYRYWIPENIARVFARGFEWNQQLKFDFSGIDFHIATNYAYTITTDESPVAKIENSAGKQLIYIPRHNGNLFLNSRYDKIKFTYQLNYTGVRNTSHNSSDLYFGRLPSFWIHNASLGYQNKNWNIDVKINNLFNKNYQAVMWRPMPERNFELGLHYRFDKQLNR